MAKQDLLAEAEALGIEGLDLSFTNREIQAAIDEAQQVPEAPEAAQIVAEAPEETPVEEVTEDEVEAAPVAAEPRFTLGQLKPFSQALFGVGGHVLVGAVSAGCIPAGKVTKQQVAHGIDQYLNMPVEQG